MPCRTGSATVSLTSGWRKPARARNPSIRSTDSATSAASGIGALEFEPALRRSTTKAKKLEIDRLVELANRALDERANLAGRLDGKNDADALEDVLSVGTSAGGARPKAVLAWNPKTGEFRSGQLDVDEGFERWLLKFDGVQNSREQGTGRSRRVRPDRIRLHQHGARCRHHDVGMPAPPRGRPQPLHDEKVRSRSCRPKAPHAVTRRDAAFRLQRPIGLIPTSRPS